MFDFAVSERGGRNDGVSVVAFFDSQREVLGSSLAGDRIFFTYGALFERFSEFAPLLCHFCALNPEFSM